MNPDITYHGELGLVSSVDHGMVFLLLPELFQLRLPPERGSVPLLAEFFELALLSLPSSLDVLAVRPDRRRHRLAVGEGTEGAVVGVVVVAHVPGDIAAPNGIGIRGHCYLIRWRSSMCVLVSSRGMDDDGIEGEGVGCQCMSR